MNQLFVYIHPLPLEPPSHCPSRTSRSSQHWAEFVLYSSFPLAAYFKHDRVYWFWLWSYLSKFPKRVCMEVHVWFFSTPQTIARQAPLSMGFFQQEYWSGLSFPPPGDWLNPSLQHLRHQQVDSLPPSHLAISFPKRESSAILDEFQDLRIQWRNVTILPVGGVFHEAIEVVLFCVWTVCEFTLISKWIGLVSDGLIRF